MAKSSSRAGWFLAAAIVVGWWVTSRDDEPASPPTPTVSRQPDAPAAVRTEPSRAVSRPEPDPRPQQHPPPTSPPSVQAVEMFTTARVRVRAGPSTDHSVVTSLDPGTPVRSTGTSGQWHSITVQDLSGWIRGDFLSRSPPAPKREAPPVAPLVRAPPARQAPAAGTPVRDPYVGTCDCPYDRMRNGRKCGGNSAYSRPGGRNPVCYW